MNRETMLSLLTYEHSHSGIIKRTSYHGARFYPLFVFLLPAVQKRDFFFFVSPAE